MVEKEHLCVRERQEARQLINSSQEAAKKNTYIPNNQVIFL